MSGAWSHRPKGPGQTLEGIKVGFRQAGSTVAALLVTALSQPRAGRPPKAVSLAAGRAVGCPPSSAKMLLGFPPCPRGQHNEVRPASARGAQRDVESGEGARAGAQLGLLP
ncbi:hypothetical protein BHE74_00024019 [Ensete ventricosum]|nr:hypothetical protein BHE74_00024019 [Ensete ventricosum]